jgi:prepilin-type N-terminal cleavage/methylation domain-containing protein
MENSITKYPKHKLVNNQDGMTLIEILVVLGIILIIGTLAIPSISQVKRRHFEDMAMLKLKESSVAEKRYYQQYRRFGTYRELVEAGFLPPGYTTRLQYFTPKTGMSTRPFIENYSVQFLVPDRPNSLWYKVLAYPIDDALGLTTFNVNVNLGTALGEDLMFQDPPLRLGVLDEGVPVIKY